LKPALACTKFSRKYRWFIIVASGVRRNFHGVCFIQWHMVVICVWCALFVTTQFEVIFMFPNNVLAKFVDIIGILF